MAISERSKQILGGAAPSSGTPVYVTSGSQSNTGMSARSQQILGNSGIDYNSRINDFNSMVASFNNGQKSFIDNYNSLVGSDKYTEDYMERSASVRDEASQLSTDLAGMQDFLQDNPWMMEDDSDFGKFYDETSKLLSETQSGLDSYEKYWQQYAADNVMTGADGKGYDMSDEAAWEEYLKSYQDAEAQAKQERREARRETGFFGWYRSNTGADTQAKYYMTQADENGTPAQQLTAAREGFREAQQARVDAEKYITELKEKKSKDEASLRGYMWYGEQIVNGTSFEAAYKNAETNLEEAWEKYKEELSKVKSKDFYAGYVVDDLSAAAYEESLVRSTPELSEAAAAIDEASEALEFAKFYRYADLPIHEGDAGYDPDILSKGAAIADDLREYAENYRHYTFSSGNVGSGLLHMHELKNYENMTLDPGSVSEDEYNTWLYLLGSGRQVEADEYAKELNNEERKAARLERAQKLSEWETADLGSSDSAQFREFLRKAAGTAIGVAAPVFTGAFDFTSNALELMATGDISEKAHLTPLQAGTIASAAIANDLNVRYGTIDDDVAVFGGKGWGDAYQLAESVMQSWLTMATFGAVGKGMGLKGEALKSFTEAGTNVSFFFSAGAQGIYDALENGISPQHAILMGVLNGAAEVLGETLSIESIFDNVLPAEHIVDLLKGTLKQAGIEASEEAFTSILNMFSDEVVNRDRSELNIALQQYLAQGMDYDQASSAAMKDWFNTIAQDAVGGFFSGAASGIVIGGGAMLAKRISYGNAQAFDSTGTIAEAKSLGDAKLEAQAKKAEARGSMTNRQQARMERRAEKAAEKQNAQNRLTAIENRLTELGETGNVQDIAVAIDKASRGERLGIYDIARDSSEHFDTVMQEIKDSAQWVKDIQTRDLYSERYERAVQNYLKEQKDNPLANNYSVEKKNATVELGGQAATLVGLEMDENDNVEAVFRMADGMRQNVQLEDAVQALPKELGKFVHLLGGKGAQAPGLFENYNDGQNVGWYLYGMDNVSNVLAGAGVSRDYILGTPEAPSRLSSMYDKLTPSQIDYAYKTGSEAREAKLKAAKALKSRKRTGTVSFEGGEIDGVKYKAVDANKRKGADVEYVSRIAKTLGVDVVFYQSTADNRGYLKGANGAYRDGVIYLDINAGMTKRAVGERMLLTTLAHELTHYFQDQMPEQYAELKKYISEYLIQAEGVSFDRLVASKISRDTSGSLTKEGAVDEVIADACETMLRDSTAMEQLAKENPELHKSLLDFIRDFLKKILDKITGVHAEAKALEQNKEVYDTVQKMWDELFVTSAQQTQTETEQKKAPAQKETEEKTSNAQMADREYNPIREKIAKEELDNLSILLGDRFPLSSKFNKTMRGDQTPLTVNVIKKNSVPYPKKQSKYAAGKSAFDLAYGGNTTVHLRGLDIDADLTNSAVSEALSKYEDHNSIREILDLIPILKDQFNNGYCFAVERVHLKKKKKAMFGFRIYNAYWEKLSNGTEIPKILVGTVVQNFDKGTYVHTFQDIKIVTASPGTSIFGSSITTSGDVISVSQLYSSVKRIDRIDGGLKYDSAKDQDKLFRYTERNDGTKYSARDIPAPYDTMSYADLQREIGNVIQRQRDLSIRRSAISDDERYNDAAMRLSESFDEMRTLYRKNHAGTITGEEKSRMDELRAERKQLEETIKLIEEEYGVEDIRREESELNQLSNTLRYASDAAWEREGAEKENKAIAKSGLEPAEYFRQKALKAFKTTSDFNEAGYLLPNGKLLNFSGGERGHRYRDHREIGEIYEGTQGTAALNRFLADGNIRIMAESPGIDLPSGIEPTAAQYAQLRKMINSIGVKEGEFYIDFSDADGNQIGSYSYDSKISADKIISDIQYFYKTGEIRQQSSLAAFYSERDVDISDLTKAELEAREMTYNQLKAENAMLKRSVDRLKKQTKLTKEKTVRQADANKIARDIIRRFDSQMDSAELAAVIKQMGDYLVQTEGADIDYDLLRSMAGNAARRALDINREIENGMEDTRRALKDYLKGQKLYLPKEYFSDMGDISDFRKQYKGIIRLAKDGLSVDSAYMELQELMGEGMFPSDIMHPADQLQRIADVWDSAQPTYGNPYERDLPRMTEELTQDILWDVISPELRQTAPTYADMAKAREAKLRADSARKLQETRERDRSRLEELRAEKNERIEQLKKQASARLEAAIAKEKAKKYEKIAAVKEHYLEKERRAKERRKESAGIKKYKAAVERKAKALYDMLNTNTDKLHVPEALKKPLAELLSSLDFSSVSSLNGRGQTQKDRVYLRRMEELRRIVENQKAYMENPSENDGLDVFLDLPPELATTIQNHIDAVTAILDNQTDVDITSPINEMSSAELQDLDFILTTLTKAIKNINKFHTESHFAGVIEASRETTAFLNSLGGAGALAIGRGKAAEQFLNWSNTIPYYAFKRFGEAGRDRFNAITQGWGKMAMNVRDIIDFSEATYTSEEAKSWEKAVHEITIGSTGAKVQMTTAQIMALYCLAKREQAMGHLMGGGMRIGNIDAAGGRKAISQVKSARLTLDDVTSITSLLTDRQIAVADALQHYMAEQGQIWGNEVSMERYGYRAFNEANYFPINTDSNLRPAADPEMQKNDFFRLLNISATKALTPNANNALVVGSIFDVFSEHMADMAKYNALALPILDILKWYNFNDKRYIDREDGQTQIEVDSVQQSTEKAFGKQGQKYMLNFIKDLNGVREGGRNEEFLKGMMGRYKGVAVAANIRVALQQPTSIVRAALQLDPRYLIQGAAMTGGIREAMQHSGLAVWKDLGYFDTNIARNMRDQIKHTEDFRDKVLDKSMKLAEMGDKVTWGAIWNACKLETIDKTGLTGEALMEATARRFDEVILSTQVIDSTISRSDIMRSSSMAVNEVTSFMSEPTVTYNALLDVWTDFMLAKRSGDTSKMRGIGAKAYKTIAVFFIASAATAAAAAFADAGRDDDDYETWAQKWLEHFWENFKDNANPLKLLPIVSDVYERLAEGDNSSSMLWAPLEQAKKAFDIGNEMLGLKNGSIKEATKTTNYGKMTTWGFAYNGALAISYLSGLPIGPSMREFKTLWNSAAVRFGAKKLRTYDPGAKSSIRYALRDGYITEEEAQQYLVEAGVSDSADDAYWLVKGWAHENDEGGWSRDMALHNAALSGDADAYEAALRELTDNGVSEKSIKSNMKTQIHEWYVGNDAGERAISSRADCEQMLQKYAGLSERDAKAQVSKWNTEVSAPEKIRYDEIGPEFIAGNISQTRASEMLQKYGGEDPDAADAKVLKWKCEKDTGIPYDGIREAFETGEITEEKAISMLKKYGGKSTEDAEKKTDYYKFVLRYPELDDITEAAAYNFFRTSQPAGISAQVHYDFAVFYNETRSDRDENGNEIKGSTKKDKVTAYIDGLDISSEQKDILFSYNYSTGLSATPWHK